MDQGQQQVEEFSEEELNAYLQLRLAPEEPDVEGFPTSFVVNQINLAFTENRFTGHIAAHWLWIPLTYEVAGSLAETAGRVDVAEQSVRIGHLPLRGFVEQYALSRVQTLLREFDREQVVFDHIARVQIGDKIIRVMVAGER